MQRGEGAKVKVVKPKPLKQFLWAVAALLVCLPFCACCGFLVNNFLSGPNWPEDFCTVEDKLYQILATKGDEWAEELANRVSNFTMVVEPPSEGQIWLMGDKSKVGFFVRVVYAPRFALGKAGYFYSRAGDLPLLGSEDELRHLEGNVYCYILDDPG